MSQGSLLERIGDWLIDQALITPPIVVTFQQLCVRLQAIGVPVARARLTWPTLHPLFRAETVLWRQGEQTEFQQFNHQEDRSEAWSLSPIAWMLENDVTVLRRRMTGREPLLDFPLVEELHAEGYTDFVAIRTALSDGAPELDRGSPNFGIYVTWTTERPQGFTDEDIDALQRVQRAFAVACKSAIQPQMTANITNTYLGPTVSREVLAGQIQLGSGSRTHALVWYSDLRNSLHYSETLDEAAYLELINQYFGVAATAAIDEGGEVLAFIGDAVLAIFPIAPSDSPVIDPQAILEATEAATRASRSALAAGEALNVERAKSGLGPIRFGIAMNIGDVRFGNIGTPRRLSFSVIGATVNEVARIEKLTKVLGASVLATEAVAAGDPEAWTPIGEHLLVGRQDAMPLFALKEAKPAADTLETEAA
ncbi:MULTISPECIES: adenylate/guanylate cyclase domain-containing protein [unclassified Aureimonas]|uniref:adenylate/guanylate cyclase domain-containing protein n=1 Tax=unclassified Aureimonas TaxID=2615206 RepID=UPI0006FD84A4|nr:MULTISPECIES: adenylate/guanylate cyclase domain-containing protein [unclassified Aureimonas]KQT64252.1 hypothetical protein ASG62_04475 [Aureimonas sp. Leaf427]KQT81441.1 hypothetical protein ASG54_01740 [Aureimonas sp. Leaf460]